jgi:predicted component of type VI protein secretion system
MGPNPGKSYDLTQDELTIGRDVSNHIVINDPEVSRRHAKLTSQTDGYIIEDMGSTNGTFVDGQRLMGPHVLRHGETVMLGEKVSLVFESFGFDPDATMIGGSAGAATPQADVDTFRVPPSPQPSYEPPPIPRTEVVPQVEEYQPAEPAYQPAFPEQPPAYSGQIPPGPVEPQVVEPSYEDPVGTKSSKNRTVILAGCGCLVLVLICVGGAAIAFDYMNLYCTPPFDALSGYLWSCPP